jgi:hypothetical protein
MRTSSGGVETRSTFFDWGPRPTRITMSTETACAESCSWDNTAKGAVGDASFHRAAAGSARSRSGKAAGGRVGRLSHGGAGGGEGRGVDPVDTELCSTAQVGCRGRSHLRRRRRGARRAVSPWSADATAAEVATIITRATIDGGGASSALRPVALGPRRAAARTRSWNGSTHPLVRPAQPRDEADCECGRRCGSGERHSTVARAPSARARTRPRSHARRRGRAALTAPRLYTPARKNPPQIGTESGAN